MRFRSKVDTWLLCVLVGAPLFAIGLPLLVAKEDYDQALLTALLPAVVFAAIYGLCLFPLHYEVGDEALVIRFGVFRSRIPYEQIRKVVPTRNPLSSPALSLDRLHIDAGSALGPNISPADKAGFLEALVKHTPHLRLDGDRLVARA